MNDEEIEKLKEKMKEFENKDIYIQIEQALQYHIKIYNSKVIVSNENLIISDGKQDFIVDLYWLDGIEIKGNAVYLDLSNDIKITLDY